MSEWRRVPGSEFVPGAECWQRNVKDGHLMVLVGQEPGAEPKP